MNEFGENLKKLRGSRTKRDFAAFLGVSPSNYQYYEAGRIPEPDRLKSIANSLGVSLDYLLGRESLSPPPPQLLREPRAELPAVAGSPLESRVAFLEEQCAAILPQLNDIRSLLVSLLAEERRQHDPSLATPDRKEKVG